MLILGLSAFYHDSAAALLDDGRIVAAAQEERFTRIKHDFRFPLHAAAYCVEHAGRGWEAIDLVVFYDKPVRKTNRLLKTYLDSAPQGILSFSAAFTSWIHGRRSQKAVILDNLGRFAPGVDWASRLLFSEHHLSHAASAFFPSPFRRAAVLVADGVGEFSTTSIFEGRDEQLTLQKEILFPHSLGLLYSAFTYYTGFKVNSGEYKLMGLAPYGDPKYVDLIGRELVELKVDGSFRLNMKYFNYCVGLTMVNDRFCELFGHPVRKPEEPLMQFHMDIAASIQKVLDDILLAITRHMLTRTNATNLCMAGGVALNCVSNGHIMRDGRFERLWVQPAAGDAGGALGAALVAHHIFLNRPRQILDTALDAMQGSYLGPEYTAEEIEDLLDGMGAVYRRLTKEELIERCTDVLASGEAVAWFQGRMEFGPRALGNRSILADPRSVSIQTTLNLAIKKRESFRPFAPAVLFEDLTKYFNIDCASPYMLLVASIADTQKLSQESGMDTATGIARLKIRRSTIPGVTHVDSSARIQTVHPETNPLFHALLCSFRVRTGCSVLVNTSFNVRGEPIVCSPVDAFRCFMTTDIAAMAIGDFFLEKHAQNEELSTALQMEFAPD